MALCHNISEWWRGLDLAHYRPIFRENAIGLAKAGDAFNKTAFRPDINHLWSNFCRRDGLGTTVSVAQAKAQFAGSVARAEAG
jgi:hypothetical protein